MHPPLVLAICCVSLLMSGMDITIVNVALPSIRQNLSASVAGLQWSVDSYVLVVGSFLILAGSMADRWGRRRVFQSGLGLFSLGSLLCSLAPTIGWLVLFRMVQALGGAMLNPVAMSIITNIYIEPGPRARAIGVWGAVSGLSLAAGPLAGGFLTEHVGWRSIFWVNIPIGLAAIALTAMFVPESRAARPRAVDLPGQLLATVLLASLVGGVIEGGRLGWHGIGAVLPFVAAAVSLASLLAWERRCAQPLIDLRFFRSAPFSSANAIALLTFTGFAGFLFLNSLFLQEVRRLSPARAGLMLLPLALATLFCAPIAGRLVASRGARLPLMLGGLALSTGALLMLGLQRHSEAGRLLLAYGVFGAGIGLINPPTTHAGVSGMPRHQAGTAAAIVSSGRQVGSALGVALAGAIAGDARGGAFIDQSRAFWWLLCACGLGVAALGFAVTSRWGRASERHTAHLL